MVTGQHTHIQANSLQAFWPGVQVLYGDLIDAIQTYNQFYSIWYKYSALPERFLLASNTLHSTERY